MLYNFSQVNLYTRIHLLPDYRGMFVGGSQNNVNVLLLEKARIGKNDKQARLVSSASACSRRAIHKSIHTAHWFCG